MINDEVQNALDSARPPSADVTEQWLKEYRALGPQLENLHAQAMKRKTVKCPQCHKRTQLGKIDATDVYRRVISYNSYEDSYDVLDYTMCKCPKCGVGWMLHRYDEASSTYHQYPLKQFFKSVTKQEPKR
jgi:ribosomal protein S27AE